MSPKPSGDLIESKLNPSSTSKIANTKGEPSGKPQSVGVHSFEQQKREVDSMKVTTSNVEDSGVNSVEGPRNGSNGNIALGQGQGKKKNKNKKKGGNNGNNTNFENEIQGPSYTAEVQSMPYMQSTNGTARRHNTHKAINSNNESFPLDRSNDFPHDHNNGPYFGQNEGPSFGRSLGRGAGYNFARNSRSFTSHSNGDGPQKWQSSTFDGSNFYRPGNRVHRGGNQNSRGPIPNFAYDGRGGQNMTTFYGNYNGPGNVSGAGFPVGFTPNIPNPGPGAYGPDGLWHAPGRPLPSLRAFPPTAAAVPSASHESLFGRGPPFPGQPPFGSVPPFELRSPYEQSRIQQNPQGRQGTVIPPPSNAVTNGNVRITASRDFSEPNTQSPSGAINSTAISLPTSSSASGTPSNTTIVPVVSPLRQSLHPQELKYLKPYTLDKDDRAATERFVSLLDSIQGQVEYLKGRFQGKDGPAPPADFTLRNLNSIQDMINRLAGAVADIQTEMKKKSARQEETHERDSRRFSISPNDKVSCIGGRSNSVDTVRVIKQNDLAGPSHVLDEVITAGSTHNLSVAGSPAVGLGHGPQGGSNSDGVSRSTDSSYVGYTITS